MRHLEGDFSFHIAQPRLQHAMDLVETNFGHRFRRRSLLARVLQGGFTFAQKLREQQFPLEQHYDGGMVDDLKLCQCIFTLGDAVFDLAITFYLFNSFQTADPGRLTDYKHRAFTQSTFGEVVAELFPLAVLTLPGHTYDSSLSCKCWCCQFQSCAVPSVCQQEEISHFMDVSSKGDVFPKVFAPTELWVMLPLLMAAVWLDNDMDLTAVFGFSAFRKCTQRCLD